MKHASRRHSRPLRSPGHIMAAAPILSAGLVIAGAISGLAVGGGIVAILWNAVSPTDMKVFGSNITTGHVGVAFTALGVIALAVVVRNAFGQVVRLAAIRDDVVRVESLVQQLTELTRLKEQGSLSKEEFLQAKGRILGEG